MAKNTKDVALEFERIRKDILSGNIKPFYLLFGTEHYYLDRICDLLADHVIPAEERDWGQLIKYGSDVTADQVVDLARQYPMMISRQLVMVKEAQLMRKVEDIGKYFDGMLPSTVLVVCYKTPNGQGDKKNIDKRTKFYKSALAMGEVFESNQLADYQMGSAIPRFAKNFGFNLTAEAGEMLAECCGTDLAKVALELDKLRRLLPEGTVDIDGRTIEENVGISRDYSAFELTKALSARDGQKCFRIVRFFAGAQKRFPIQPILAALSTHFIRILKCHSLIAQKSSTAEIASAIGVNPYFMREYYEAVGNYSLAKTMTAISLLKEYDMRSKSNTRGSADDGDLLLELVSKLLAC